MSSNLSVGGSSANLPERPAFPTAHVEVKENKTSSISSDSSAAVMLSSRDIKAAERNGESVSMGDEQVIKSIERAVKAMQGHTTSLEFSIHQKTKAIMVKVINKDTGELIREIPPEKTLDFVAKLMEKAGLLVDERM